MTIFDQTETGFEHDQGELVKYDNTVMVIGGFYNATVEKLNANQTKWEEHETMSPVNGFSEFWGFTALSMEKSLFIFGQFRLVK